MSKAKRLKMPAGCIDVTTRDARHGDLTHWRQRMTGFCLRGDKGFDIRGYGAPAHYVELAGK